MVDREYSRDDYKSPKISTGPIMKNPEMLKFVPNYFKIKKCVNTQLKDCLV